ncbi:unnamed protein product [marine sediment metagenome]|uniref:Uncharacterized protein n=1 Tax=marine sediment metagenome TaxID=412755 RepID=X1IDU1_9ZZZZ
MPDVKSQVSHTKSIKNKRPSAGNRVKRKKLIVTASDPRLLETPGLIEACCEAVSAYNAQRAR